jgi:DNA-directed RNA polymerase subunit K/omega
MSDDEKSIDNENDNENENDDILASSNSDNEDDAYKLGNNSSDNDSVPEDDDELLSEDEKDNPINEPGSSLKQTDSDVELYEEDEDEDEEDDNDDYALQKFNTINKLNYLTDAHPECLPDNYEDIIALTKLTRDEYNNIVDPLHKTIPILTKYEKTRVLGQRAKQIEHGGDIFVKTDTLIIEPHIIAEYELKFKKIPFIIKRPVPGGGGFEYWCLSDLEDLNPL